MSGGRTSGRGVDPTWRDLVVLFAGVAWDSNRGTEQHLAAGLTRYAPVLYVDPPRSILEAPRPDRHLGGALEIVRPRLARLTPPALPGQTRPVVRRTTDVLRRRAVRRAVATLGGDVAAVVSAGLNDVFGACGERRRLLFATDDFVTGARLMGLSTEHVLRQETERAAQADVLVAVSEQAGSRWRDAGREVHVIPNGCDVDHFTRADTASPPDDVDLPAPIAGLIGHLSPRIDASLLAAVADAGISVLLVGPVGNLGLGELESVVARPNVAWVGAKSYDELPSYLRVIDVGLVPYVDDAFNRASFPLKTLEYLAAGTPVVATDLPAIRELAAEGISIASSPTDFASAVRAASTLPSDPAAVESRRAVATASSWETRVAELAQLLGLSAAATPPPAPG